MKACGVCGLQYEPGLDPDPCLGTLPGVVQACCGHGVTSNAYVMFENGVLVRGIRRIENWNLDRAREATK